MSHGEKVVRVFVNEIEILPFDLGETEGIVNIDDELIEFAPGIIIRRYTEEVSPLLWTTELLEGQAFGL